MHNIYIFWLSLTIDTWHETCVSYLLVSRSHGDFQCGSPKEKQIQPHLSRIEHTVDIKLYCCVRVGWHSQEKRRQLKRVRGVNGVGLRVDTERSGNRENRNTSHRSHPDRAQRTTLQEKHVQIKIFWQNDYNVGKVTNLIFVGRCVLPLNLLILLAVYCPWCTLISQGNWHVFWHKATNILYVSGENFWNDKSKTN